MPHKMEKLCLEFKAGKIQKSGEINKLQRKQAITGFSKWNKRLTRKNQKKLKIMKILFSMILDPLYGFKYQWDDDWENVL